MLSFVHSLALDASLAVALINLNENFIQKLLVVNVNVLETRAIEHPTVKFLTCVRRFRFKRSLNLNYFQSNRFPNQWSCAPL